MIKEELENNEDIIKECEKINISMIINGYNNITNKEIIDLSNKYNNVYSSIGLNYDEVDSFTDDDLVLLEELIKSNKINAIGEIGLDYYWTTNIFL